ncbi:hypothetical protein D3C87_234620 [compost metagenome]
MKKLTTLKLRNRTASRNLALGLLLSVSSALSFGQTVTTILDTGTGTSPYVPIHGNYDYSYTQQIYLATDFNAAVAGQMNQITKVRFFNSTGNLISGNNWTVYMGSTNKTTFDSNSDFIPVGNLTQVFSGILTASGANTWMEITLATPFVWDGVSNVVIAVDENAAGWSNINWRVHPTGANRSIYISRDGANVDPAAPAGTQNGRLSSVPQTQFVHEIAPACSATPNHATAVASVSTVCSNSPTPVNLSRTGATFASGLTYQWQYNSGGGWVNYAGGTTQNYAVSPAQTVNVRLVTTCAATAVADTSDDVTIAVNLAPSLSLNESSVTYCAGAPVQVVAQGALTYAWTPATGLNVTNNDTVAASPANPTTYRVIGTDLAGCKDTATVFVTPLSKIEKTATYAPSALCSPGSPVTITASATPANINGGGAYEYRFIASNGAILQDWNASNTYGFVPGADSIYKIYTDFRSNACPDAVDSILTSVIVGFGGDAAIVNYDCINLGGTVSMNNVFGQTAVNTVYSNPFASASTDLTNVTLQGAAAINGGRMVLTGNTASLNGSAIINDPAFHAGTNNAMTLSFNLTADMPYDFYGTGGGDGLTYSFADDIANNGNQNGSGSKLRLVFDAADNTANLRGIYLVYGNTGGVSGTSVTPGAGSTLFYSNNIDLWKTKTDIPVVLTIGVDGKASLTVDGTTIFSNVQMPPAYMNANTSTWRHAFSASTGGDALRHAISNVVVTAPSYQFAMVPANQTPATWQSGRVFTSVQPGTYDVWMSSNGTSTCSKKVKTIEVLNTNPLVLLGNDTTICEGESLILNAGNAGATYVWSNSQITTQTREVTQAGPYVVNVTAANGCVGVGSINIGVMEAPSASTIFVQNNMPTYTFTVLNPENVNQYSWDFGDGTTLTNTPGTVTHTFTTTGPKMVTATLTNECGTETVIATVVVTSTASVATNEIEGLNVYPNPASERVIVELPTAAQATGSVYNTTGSLVKTIENFSAKTEISVSDLTPGVYFLNVQSEQKTSIIKLVVE